MAETILSLVATVGNRLSDLPIKDGQLIFVQDKRKIAMDLNSKRVFYNEIAELETEEERSALTAPAEGFYFVIETAVLWTYRNQAWVRITTPPEEIVRIGVDLPELGRRGLLYVDTARQEISVWDESTGTYVVVANTTHELTAEEVLAMFEGQAS